MERQNYEYFRDERDDRISKRTFLTFAFILVFFYTIVFVTNIFFQQSYMYITVNGMSMQPTLNSRPVSENGKSVQDGVYVKLTKNADYGDIIIVDRIEESNHTVIKRLLGKEKDKISIIKLNINGSEEYRFLRIKAGDTRVEVVYEKYINGACYDTSGNKYQLGYQNWSSLGISEIDNFIKYEPSFYNTFLADETGDASRIFTYDVLYSGQTYNSVKFYEIEDDKMFYMGDNRTGSTDCRTNGTEDVDKIIGKVEVIAHNASSPKNSPIYFLNKTKGYLEVIWKEIINIFSWKA